MAPEPTLAERPAQCLAGFWVAVTTDLPPTGSYPASITPWKGKKSLQTTRLERTKEAEAHGRAVGEVHSGPTGEECPGAVGGQRSWTSKYKELKEQAFLK